MWKSIFLISCILFCASSVPMIEQIMMANSLSFDIEAMKYWDCDPCTPQNKPTRFYFAKDSQPKADSFLTTYQSYPNPYGGSGTSNFAVINFVYLVTDERYANKDFLQTMEVPVSYCADCGIQKTLAAMTLSLEQSVRFYLNVISSKKIKDVYLTGNAVGGSIAQAFFPIVHQISEQQSYGFNLNMSVFSPLGVGNSQWTSYVLNTYGHTRVFYWQNDTNEALPICDNPQCTQLRATGDIFYCSVQAGECVTSRYQVQKKGNLRANIEKWSQFKKLLQNFKFRILTNDENLQRWRFVPYWTNLQWFKLSPMGIKFIYNV